MLTKLSESEKFIKTSLTPFAEKFKSKRLRKLVTLNNVDNEEDEYQETQAMIYYGYSDEEEGYDQKREKDTQRIEIEKNPKRN